ncbi:MAG: flagellar hook-length control protein FliK [Candidatus Marinimicrobia bacterium]|nr:flagellar hook-length control protein FliK [Candidatus Neomarinimicrobiota bacterium]
MKSTEQIVNLLNPILKSDKGSKLLLSKLSKDSGPEFKDILTSMDISESEKMGIISELLHRFESKKKINSTVNSSDILKAENSLSGNLKKHSTSELSSKGKAELLVQTKLLKTTTNGWQIKNLVMTEKTSLDVKNESISKNVSIKKAAGLNKFSGQKKQRSINVSKPTDLISRNNIKKDFTQRNGTDVITQANLTNLRVLDNGAETTEAIKKFGTQLKDAKNSSRAITNVGNESLSKSTAEKFTNPKSRPVINQETLNKIIDTSVEKALSKNVSGYEKQIEHNFDDMGGTSAKPNGVGNPQMISREMNESLKNNISSEKNIVLESMSENKIKGSSDPVDKRPKQTIGFNNRNIPDQSRNLSKRTGKDFSLRAPDKTTDLKDHGDPEVLRRIPNAKEISNKKTLDEKNVHIESTKRFQSEKEVVKESSFLISSKKLSNSQLISSAMPIHKSMKAFNSAGKRVNTVVAKARKVSRSKSVNGSERVQPNSPVMNVNLVQKSYNKQLEFSNFEKDYLNNSNIIGDKIGNGFELHERFENNLSKVRTTFFSNGVAFSADKMLNAHQMKLSIKMINNELANLQLRISPKGLGNIRIDIQQEGKALYTKFFVETAEVAGILQESLPELKEILAQQGLKMENTQISSKEDELRQYLSEKNNNEFKEKSDGKRSSLSLDYQTEIATELLAQRSAPLLSPYSTVEYLV